MTCFYPLAAVQPIVDGRAEGAVRIVGAADDSHAGAVARTSQRVDGRYLEIPCGQCIGCRLDRTSNWASRFMCESLMHESNWFATLTYKEESCPRDGGLRYADVQAAWKRLSYYQRVRHGTCGEYGSVNLRPHYHAILFGLRLDDVEPWRKSPAGHQLFRSRSFEERIWPHGNAEFGSVSYDSCAYVAAYCVKKVTGKAAEVRSPVTGLLPYERIDSLSGEVVSVEPEFLHVSKRPAIGVPFLEKYGGDVYNVHDAVILHGRKQRVPRAFDRWLEKQPGLRIDELKADRLERAVTHADDQTRARMETRAAVTRAKFATKERSL